MAYLAVAAARSRLLIFTAAALLIIYLVLLLGTTFYSQQQLHRAAHASLHSELQKRASALSYFYSERRADIDRMARDSTMTVFFSNRALGMSMEYGLRASLLGMRDLARAMVSARTLDRAPIYQRIVIEDANGEILVDEGQGAGQPPFWTGTLQSASTTPELLVSAEDIPKTYLVAAVSRRGKRVGKIIAQVDHDIVINSLVLYQSETTNYVVGLVARTAEPITELTPCALPDVGRGTQTCHREPIADTPFEIVFSGDIREIEGVLASEGYFFALVFLAVALLALLGLMAWQIQARERDLIASRDALAESNAQLRKSQKQLVQSEKMASLGILAAGVAHEINNPIGYIQGNLATLQDYQAVLVPLVEDYRSLVHERAETEPELPQRWEARLRGEDLDFLLDDLDSLMTDTVEGGHRVAGIVAGLRSFVRSDEARNESVDINACVATALSLASNALEHRAQVEQRLGELPPIQGSSGQIAQVLVNLLVNAAQSIQERGQILIETRVEEAAILVQVSDNGCGIAPEHLDQLFTPFFTTKAVGAGTGLGLSISQGIVERHGGAIRVESELGHGSCFTLIFPIDESDIVALKGEVSRRIFS